MGSLLPVERHRRIEALLRERQALRVSELGELLGVSEVTVRRDLEALERGGVLERIHGGAVATQRVFGEPRYFDAIVTYAEEKLAIGRAAARLVAPGDTLFMNAGSTTLEVFRHLASHDLTVVTNNVGTALEAGAVGTELILTGGLYHPASNSCADPMAMDLLRRVYATKAIIGVEGVSARYGITTSTAAEAELVRLMIERTRGEVVVVADHSKLGKVADFMIAGLDQVGRLVVDSGISAQYRESLANLELELLIADLAEETARAWTRA